MPASSNVPGQIVGDNFTNFPPSFSYDGLSVLLSRSIPSLQADKCRKPWTLPPACKIPGAKAPVWLLADVLDWLAAHREPTVAPPEVEPAARRRGRPTKAEQAVRAAAGSAGFELRTGAEGMSSLALAAAALHGRGAK